MWDCSNTVLTLYLSGTLSSTTLKTILLSRNPTKKKTQENFDFLKSETIPV